ncbi:MAG: acylphosphatase [Planctomycetes bacterium]|nr:acylphosphatase [Planctomycetota bacterium]
MTAERAHLIVSGLVQGVFFRASTRDVARGLALSGFVRNLPDGRVEAVAEGPRPALESFVAWCREGPPHAAVSDLHVEWLPATGEFAGFSVRR